MFQEYWIITCNNYDICWYLYPYLLFFFFFFSILCIVMLDDNNITYDGNCITFNDNDWLSTMPKNKMVWVLYNAFLFKFLIVTSIYIYKLKKKTLSFFCHVASKITSYTWHVLDQNLLDAKRRTSWKENLEESLVISVTWKTK